MNDGGPAFPYGITGEITGGSDGMSLHKWFAGMALCGMVRMEPDELSGKTISYEGVASSACAYADAMIKILESGKARKAGDD